MRKNVLRLVRGRRPTAPPEDKEKFPLEGCCGEPRDSETMAAAFPIGDWRRIMADEVVANQKTILQNQKSILANQKAILANQAAIRKNQMALSAILTN